MMAVNEADEKQRHARRQSSKTTTCADGYIQRKEKNLLNRRTGQQKTGKQKKKKA
jgi:hypothetical protein